MSEEALSDQASSLFQAAQAVGCIFGPIVGGMLNDMVRFQSTCDIMAITCMLYATMLYVFMMDGRQKVVSMLKQLLKKHFSSQGASASKAGGQGIELSAIVSKISSSSSIGGTMTG